MLFGLSVRCCNVAASRIEGARHLVEGNAFIFPSRLWDPSGAWHGPEAAAAARRLPYQLVADVPVGVGIDQVEGKDGPIGERGAKLLERLCLLRTQESPYWERVQPDCPHRDGAKLAIQGGTDYRPAGCDQDFLFDGFGASHPDHLPPCLALDVLAVF